MSIQGAAKARVTAAKERISQLVRDAHEVAHQVGHYLTSSEIDAMLADFQLSDFWDKAVKAFASKEMALTNSRHQFSSRTYQLAMLISSFYDHLPAASLQPFVNELQANDELYRRQINQELLKLDQERQAERRSFNKKVGL